MLPAGWAVTVFSQFMKSLYSMEDGNGPQSFSFLKHELPVRICNIMKEINLLPEKLLQMPSARTVKGWYQQTLEDLLEFEDSDDKCINLNTKFTEQLITIRNRHSNVVETMAQAVLEMRESYEYDQHEENNIQYFLNRFYISRISIRMLINQHTLLFGSAPKTHPRHIGSIDPNTDVVSVVADAYDSAKFLCDQYYLASPDVEIKTINSKDDSNNIHIVYVPSHLYHILFELFKNSMRAVMEHKGPSATDFPKIKVLITKGQQDLTIRMSDEGGGIPRTQIDQLFNYMYTTAPTHLNLVSLPFHLWLYAKYFHGDLTLTSMEGYGTDALIYLKVLSSEANELLPIYNHAVNRHYRANLTVSDWSSPMGGFRSLSLNSSRHF
ncbi:putative pyruvate dehydrogenase (acetyl-transferring) kinase isozyme 2, mitochondrial [Apostichopus japonicus]|uniref:Protein-serine/threonine kinase n=1 Tax=Stichopus japonicus TaxID=307972 RepID=A0A2G8KPR0_STIJA|nr:putative pyruvate dehydrogenase (acetyl-transferring) kinase isozyme 2, mitochondrial [Apostichopus japonicus]